MAGGNTDRPPWFLLVKPVEVSELQKLIKNLMLRFRDASWKREIYHLASKSVQSENSVWTELVDLNVSKNEALIRRNTEMFLEDIETTMSHIHQQPHNCVVSSCQSCNRLDEPTKRQVAWTRVWYSTTRGGPPGLGQAFFIIQSMALIDCLIGFLSDSCFLINQQIKRPLWRAAGQVSFSQCLCVYLFFCCKYLLSCDKLWLNQFFSFVRTTLLHSMWIALYR